MMPAGTALPTATRTRLPRSP